MGKLVVFESVTLDGVMQAPAHGHEGDDHGRGDRNLPSPQPPGPRPGLLRHSSSVTRDSLRGASRGQPSCVSSSTRSVLGTSNGERALAMPCLGPA